MSFISSFCVVFSILLLFLLFSSSFSLPTPILFDSSLLISLSCLFLLFLLWFIRSPSLSLNLFPYPPPPNPLNSLVPLSIPPLTPFPFLPSPLLFLSSPPSAVPLTSSTNLVSKSSVLVRTLSTLSAPKLTLRL